MEASEARPAVPSRAEKIVPYEKSANHEGITKWLNPRKAKPGGLPEAIGLRLMIPANQMEIIKWQGSCG